MFPGAAEALSTCARIVFDCLRAMDVFSRQPTHVPQILPHKAPPFATGKPPRIFVPGEIHLTFPPIDAEWNPRKPNNVLGPKK